MHSIGLIGVGVMGQNLALNIERNGFSVAVFDRDQEKVGGFLSGKGAGKHITGTRNAAEFLGQLESPRRVLLLVNAGKPVDDVIDGLRPGLQRNDVIIDGGNSFFLDTERRHAALALDGIAFIGSGISGGEEGALKGPSIMPGGDREAYDRVAPVLLAIAARVHGEPCCAYMGPRGAGHYVKMVHNGIEYAIMQLICEAYDILQHGLGLPAPEIARVFAGWNATELNSYLFEITALVLSRHDPETGRPLVDLILDTAEQKGTGKWTSQNAFDLGVPVPTINAAVESRMLSSFKEQRSRASKVLRGPRVEAGGSRELVEGVRAALHASIIASYAQGMALLQAASAEYRYELNLASVAAIWRGGCIIRSRMLEAIREAFGVSPAPVNMMTDRRFSETLNLLQEPWRNAVAAAVRGGIPVPAMASALAYYDGYRSERLPANLLQAQRDYFGAHTYRRIDKEGAFHTAWEA